MAENNAEDPITEALDDAFAIPDLEGRSGRFVGEGVEIEYEEFGAGAITYVLVHGIGMGKGVFAELVDDLRYRGRVIVFDQPGYGASPEPARTPTMERSADIVAGLLRYLDVDGVIAIGHSMGTQVVTELAVRHPHLVSRVVLLAPTVDASARKALVQLRRLTQDLWGESLKVLWLGGREYLRAGPHLIRKMRAMMVHKPELVYPLVTQPTLVMRGELDLVVPRAWAMRAAELIPDARYAELAGTHHQTMIKDATKASLRIGRFLAETL